jgi:hypothetical protein
MSNNKPITKEYKNFRQQYSKEERINIRLDQEKKNLDKVVIAIIEPIEKKDFSSTTAIYQPLKRRKFCLQYNIEAKDLQFHVRKQLTLDQGEALIFYIQKNEETETGIKTSYDVISPMQLVASLPKSEDGIVYIKYSGESAFGSI